MTFGEEYRIGAAICHAFESYSSPGQRHSGRGSERLASNAPGAEAMHRNTVGGINCGGSLVVDNWRRGKTACDCTDQRVFVDAHWTDEMALLDLEFVCALC